MRCIYCEHIESKVLDSRSLDDGDIIKRRRECLACSRRFTTKEIVETSPMLVVKSDKTRELFDSNKIRTGVVLACQKRRIAVVQIDAVVESVSKKALNGLDREISSKKIGEFVMEELKKLDEVAYVRFASVYRNFTDATTFLEFVKDNSKYRGCE